MVQFIPTIHKLTRHSLYKMEVIVSTDIAVLEAIVTAARRPQTYLSHAREAVSVARCALRYPLGLADTDIRGPGSGGDAGHHTPVILLHGYAHNRSGWYVLERHLAKAGFSSVHTINYSPFRHDVPELAARLADTVEALQRVTGIDRVHLVGHSLGGIIARWYVQELGGDRHVATAVAIGSPHEGTVAAYAGPGRTASQLRPGSAVIRRLAEGACPSPVRWVAYYSNTDLLVQPSPSGMLRHPALGAVNILAKDHGHLSLMLSPKVARSVVDQLEAAEGVPGVAPLAGLEKPARPVAARPRRAVSAPS